MACYKFQNEVACTLLNRDAAHEGVPMAADGYPWHDGPVLSSRQLHDGAAAQGAGSNFCQGKAAGTCFGVDVAVDGRVIAVSGTGAGGERYVQVLPLPCCVVSAACRASRILQCAILGLQGVDAVYLRDDIPGGKRRAQRCRHAASRGASRASYAALVLCRCRISFTTTPKKRSQ